MSYYACLFLEIPKYNMLNILIHMVLATTTLFRIFANNNLT